MNALSRLFSELRRRNVLKAGGAYAAGAWVFFQIADTLFLLVGAPDWVSRVLLILLGLGLPFMVAFAWAFELTPEGLRRTEEVDPAQSQTKETGRRIQYLIVGLLGLAVVVLAADRFAGGSPAVPSVASSSGTARIAGISTALQEDALAVMPFTTSGPETDVWQEGMMSMLTTNLDGMGGLQAVSPRTVLARIREIGAVGTDLDLQQTLQTARATGAAQALVGSVVSTGETVRITAELYDTETGDVRGRLRVEGEADNFLQLVDQFTVQAVEASRSAGEGRDVLPVPELSALTTTSLPALRAYLAGEALYRQMQIRAAMRQFERAVALDSTFAMAHLRLVLASDWAGVTDPADVEDLEEKEQALRIDQLDHTRKAQRHGQRLPPREMALLESAAAYTVDYEIPETIGILRRGAESHPTDPELWYQFGETQAVHPASMPTAQPAARQDGLGALRRALALDSTLTPVYPRLIEPAIARGDTVEAWRLLAAYDRHDGQDGETQWSRSMRAALALAYGDSAAQANVIRQLEAGVFRSAGIPVFYALRWNPSADAVQAQIRFGQVFAERFGVYGHLRRGWRHAGQYDRLRAHVMDTALTSADGQGSRLATATVLVRRGAMAVEDVPAELAENASCSMDAPVSLRLLCYYSARMSSYRQQAGLPGPHDARLRAARSVMTATIPQVAGGSFVKQVYAGYLDLLDGLAMLRRGDPAAHDALDAAHQKAVGAIQGASNWDAMEQQVRALIEAGDPARAVPYAATIATIDPYGHYLTGRAHEALGDKDAARTAYEQFVSAWRDADPEIPALQYARSVLDGTAAGAPLL